MDFELLSYRGSVENQVSYNRKKDYFILIHEYLSGIISLDEFQDKFLEMENEDARESAIILKDFQKLEVFTFAKDLEKFSDPKDRIGILCSEYYEIWNGTIERMAETKFYSLVNNYYLQLQEAFPLENFK